MEGQEKVDPYLLLNNDHHGIDDLEGWSREQLDKIQYPEPNNRRERKNGGEIGHIHPQPLMVVVKTAHKCFILHLGTGRDHLYLVTGAKYPHWGNGRHVPKTMSRFHFPPVVSPGVPFPCMLLVWL